MKIQQNNILFCWIFYGRAAGNLKELGEPAAYSMAAEAGQLQHKIIIILCKYYIVI